MRRTDYYKTQPVSSCKKTNVNSEQSEKDHLSTIPTNHSHGSSLSSQFKKSNKVNKMRRTAYYKRQPVSSCKKTNVNREKSDKDHLSTIPTNHANGSSLSSQFKKTNKVNTMRRTGYYKTQPVASCKKTNVNRENSDKDPLSTIPTNHSNGSSLSSQFKNPTK